MLLLLLLLLLVVVVVVMVLLLLLLFFRRLDHLDPIFCCFNPIWVCLKVGYTKSWLIIMFSHWLVD